MGLAFTKMHGAGNDFVIVDCRTAPLALDGGDPPPRRRRVG